jgi:branched-chain amino acid transport system ATP-binding protein
MSAVLLDVKNITMEFGGLKAVDSFSMQVPKGVLYGLIGPNGAGKTTVFNMLTGVYRPTHGEVFLEGQSLLGLKPHEICYRGLARTFQNIRLFKSLSVIDNVLIAAYQHCHANMLDVFFQTHRFLSEEKNLREQARGLLDVFGLKGFEKDQASSLPYGSQRKLEIVRALMSRPKMILLDEPAAGMNHAETESLMKLIEKVRTSFGVTILLIEHDMKLVMGVCEKIFVLDYGIMIEAGSAQEIRKSPRVIQAYLGVDQDI